MNTQTDIIEYLDWRPEFSADYKRLNVEWIAKYFRVEAKDERSLDNPEQYVIRNGGQIVFARCGKEIVGCGALVHVAPGIYEIAKMAVTAEFQGKGIGRQILLQLIRRWHATLDGKTLFIESNRSLQSALALYRSVGFVEKPFPHQTEYERADIYMEYEPATQR